MKKVSIIKRIARKLRTMAFTCYQRLPRGLKYHISMIMYKPKLGKKVKMYGYGIIGPNVVIGDYSYLNDCFHITNINIGKYVRIAKSFQYIPKINEYSHFSNYKFWGLDNSPLLPYISKENLSLESTTCNIGNDVWIGENVTILGNVTVGNGAVIGANSVVTKNVEPYSIVVGNPAHMLKYRLGEKERNMMETIKWWEWPIEKIYINYDYLIRFQDILIENFKNMGGNI